MRSFLFCGYVFVTSILCIQPPAHAQHVGIDRSYGENGISKMLGSATPSDDSEWFNQTQVAPLGDGRAYVFLARGTSFSIARFAANGAPDPTFNGGLALDTPAGFGACAHDEQGRVLCAHSPYSDSQTLLVNVRRYLSNGVVDLSFGASGVSSLALPNPGSYVGQMAFQAVTQVVRSDDANGYLLRVARSYTMRLTETGTLDTSYGIQGILKPAGLGVVLAVDATGRQYQASTADGGVTFDRIWRVLPSGTFDSTYGNAGSIQVPNLIGMPYEYGTTIGLDGRLYVSYASFPYGTSPTSIIRLSATGTLDSSWGTQGVLTLDQQIGYTRIGSVSSSGELLVGSQVPAQSSFAVWTFRKFSSQGQPDIAFGGKGITRIPDENNQGMRIVSVAFDSFSGKIFGAGSISTPQNGVSAIRLSRSFTHRVRIDSLTSSAPPSTTPSTRISYTSGLRFDAVISGDAGPPALANARVRINDSAGTSCSIEYGLCFISPSNVGVFTPTLDHPGDFMYSGIVFAGQPIEVVKARIRVGVPYDSTYWVGPPKLNVSRQIAPAVDPRVVSGVFRVSDGDGFCDITAAQFAVDSAPSCRFSHKTPGEKILTVQLLGDPNFEQVVVMDGQMRATVLPAILSGSFGNPNGKQYSFQVTTSDPNCGLFNYGGLWTQSESTNLPPQVKRAQMREGGAYFKTVDDCSPGVSVHIVVQETSSPKSISATYTLERSGTFTRSVHTPTGTLTWDLIDNGSGDSGTQQQLGELAFMAYFESSSSDEVCFVELREPRKESLAVLLIRFALGFRDSALVAGTDFGYPEFSFWTENLSCPACSAEIDVNGNGVFDLADALLLKRWLTGQRTLTSVTGGYVATAGSRSASDVLSYLRNGCK